MSLNQTPSAERVHIALFGKRNVGKSSIINAITNQELSIVSPTEGTTTDPVYKSMEILPLGPVVLIDTAGLDDDGVLGAQRIQKSYQVLNKTDIAVLIVDSTRGLSQLDYDLIERFHKKELPFVIVFNKADVCAPPHPLRYERALHRCQRKFRLSHQGIKGTDCQNDSSKGQHQTDCRGFD